MSMDTYTQRQQLSGDDVPESNSNPHCINSTGPDEPQPQVALNYQNSLRRDLDRIDSSNVVPNPDEPPQTIHPRLLSDKSKRWVAFKTRFMKEMQRLREEKARQEALARRRPPKIPESYAEAVAIMVYSNHIMYL